MNLPSPDFRLETPRLLLRPLTLDDAPFILELLNEPSFLEHIGDKGARDLDGARTYLLTGPLDSYARHGLGLLHVGHREGGASMGICGLLRRPGLLDDPDVGFAFSPAWWGGGYAHEAAAAVLDWGRSDLGLRRILGITKTDNIRSIRLLEKLGLRLEGKVQLYDGEPEDLLFAISFPT
ncbi:MAG TPA: GNAT family N-acetyltransferase [Holophagaceae bacterium]|nr:GNAT family N-acetyltransferase [Holophagaceae bacterium]